MSVLFLADTYSHKTWAPLRLLTGINGKAVKTLKANIVRNLRPSIFGTKRRSVQMRSREPQPASCCGDALKSKQKVKGKMRVQNKHILCHQVLVRGRQDSNSSAQKRMTFRVVYQGKDTGVMLGKQENSIYGSVSEVFI